MKIPKKLASTLFVFTLILLPAQMSLAQTHKEFTPTISIIEEYDDNIFLSDRNEISSYITMVSPGFNFSFLAQHTQLELEYAPTFVWYSESSVDSEVRHEGSLTFGQDITEHIRFDLTDTYTQSDDPLEGTEGVTGARETRNTYKRNAGSASITYRFGPENELEMGYRDERLENEEESEDDGTTHTPYASIIYHINVKNRLELEYAYTSAHFWRDDGFPAEEDFNGHEPSITYYYSFTPHTTGSLEYALTTRNFDGAEEDFKVHEAMFGFEHEFSAQYSISAGVGYFIQDNVDSSNETGPMYTLLITRSFERGHIEIGGEGGWDEAVLDPDDAGFSRYWSGTASLEYQILEPLTAYATGSFRHDRDEEDWLLGGTTYDNRNYDITRVTCGLSWEFLRWFSLALDYTHAERDDDWPTESYTDNRISLILTFSRLYRW